MVADEKAMLVQMHSVAIGSLPLHGCPIVSGVNGGEDEDHGMCARPDPVKVFIIIPGKLDVARCGNQFGACTFEDCTKQNAARDRASARGEYDARKIDDNAAVCLLLKTYRRLRGRDVVH